MKNKEHLPIYGPGPIYVCVITALTLTAALTRDLPLFASGRLGGIHTVLMILGIVFIAGGIALWVYAVPISKIDDGIKENRLVTTGAYALVRNPIYSAAMIVCTGVILIISDAWFFILPFVYWLFMTVLMKATEETLRRKAEAKHHSYRPIPVESQRYRFVALNEIGRLLVER